MSITMQRQRTKRPERAREVAELISQGLPLVEIRRRLGISPGEVRRILRDHRLPRHRACRKSPTLTERRIRILKFVHDFTNRNLFPPTFREVAGGCGLSTSSLASHHLGVLQEMGYLTRVPTISRSIVLTERGRARASR